MNDVQKVYLILTIIWLLIIIIFQLYKTNWIGWIIILIPFIVFFANSFNTDIDNNVENVLASDTSLTIGIILLLPLLAYADKSYHAEDRDRTRYISIIIFALILFLLTYVVIWVPSDYIYLINRVKTGLITMSVTLILYVLYLYFDHRTNRKNCIPDDVAEEYDRISLWI